MKSSQHRRIDHENTPLADNGPSSVSGPRDEGPAIISLSELIAMEDAAAAAAGAYDEDDDGLIDFSAPSTGEEQGYTGYIGVFPFGAPTGPAVVEARLQAEPFDVAVAAAMFDAPGEPTLFGRSSELTPLPFEMPILAAPTGRLPSSTPRAVRYGSLGLAAAATVALVVGLGAPRDAPRAPAYAGVSQAARSVEARLPRVVAPAPLAAEREAPRQDAKGKKGKKRRGAGAAPRAAQPPTASAPAPASEPVAAPPAQAARAPGSDACNGDLACAMHRATGN